MKKIYIFMLIVMLFSFIAEVFLTIPQVYAGTIKTELINDEHLQLAYETELKESTTLWRLTFRRQSTDGTEQRLKLKLTDNEGETIEYPVVEQMTEKKDYLIEENFSSTMEGQVVVELPKSVEQLQLYVQLDQKGTSEDTEIQKDILTRQKPYKLEIQKAEAVKATSETKEPTTSESTKASIKKEAKKVAVTVESKEFIGPKEKANSIQSLSETPMGLTNNYSNKEPDYTTDPTGTYPTASWQPNNQTNVINHQGGDDNVSGWDGVTNWDTSKANYTDSYINYGVGKRTDISLRKYATETAKEDEFNVRLNVRGNSLTKPGVDLFFVLDNSASMGYKSPHPPYGIEENGTVKPRKDVAVASLKNLMTKFKEDFPEGSEFLRMGGVVYGNEILKTYDLSGDTADWDKIVDGYRDTSTTGHNTYTQGGLIEAQEKLNASEPNRRKVVLLLTDGAPTVSKMPTEGKLDSNIFYDGIRITKYDDSKAPSNFGVANYTFLRWHDGYVGSTNYQLKPIYIKNADGGANLKVQSHIDMANSQAAEVKESGIEIQSVAIGITKTEHEYHSKNDLLKGLYRMATRKSDATGDTAEDYYFHHVEKASEFESSFNDWYYSILTTVEKGTIEDPLGDMVELVGTPTVTDVSTKNGSGAKSIESSKMAAVDASDARTVKVTNINLYGNQEIQVDYKVRLKMKDERFVSRQWYQANGQTTLTPTPDRSTDVLDFGVPSVRAELRDFVIPVEKIWQDKQRNTEDYWGLRGESVTVVLQKNKDGTWVDVETKELTKTKWKTEFTAVEGGSNIYRVKEVACTTGYGEPTYNYTDAFTAATIPDEGVQITNKLLTETATFYKYMGDGKTVFTKDRPKFSVKRKKDNKVLATDLTPDDNGLVTIPNVPMGEFIISETYVPVGYVKMDDITLKAVEKADGSGLTLTMNDQALPFKATNNLMPFLLTIKKVDAAGEDLTGATFKVEGTDYEQTKSGGPEFLFDMLRPGDYTLTETVSPNSFERIKEPIHFTINHDGSVTIQEHENVEGTSKLDENLNTINLTVMNKKVLPGALPYTGGGGTNILFMIAFGLVGIALVLSGGYWVYQRRN